MTKLNTNQYSSSTQFQTLLDKHGIDLYSPHDLKPVPNTDAERIIPQNMLFKWLHRLFSFLILMLFISLLVFPESVYASRDASLEALDLKDTLTIIITLLTFIFSTLLAFFYTMHTSLKSYTKAQLKKMKPCTVSEQKKSHNDNTKNQLSILVGGATRKGKIREENQDAFQIDKTADGYGLLVVCDGVGGHPGGREAAQFSSEFLQRFISSRLRKKAPSPKELQIAIQATQRAFSSQKLEGMSTVIIALIASNTVHYATLGDGDLVVIHPDGMHQSLLAPHHALGQPDNIITAHLSSKHTFTARTGAIQVESGSLILAMSDGVSELLDIDQIALNQQAYIKAFNEQGISSTSDQILKDLEEARDEETDALLHSDNMTLAIALIKEENHHESC